MVDFKLNDILRLRKAHPCGGYEWKVYRIGADIGIVCLTCDRRLLIPRSDLEKRLKNFISRGE
ncbi:DUF951 domain-containing protein [Dehalogenimonas alkenigignens]|uniref:DUF951 domain-containing protein n=1 Tax=Dehalogenimonas alkenigignens TaxID=1217799 RepID=A0A0W0GGJ1_9CHLR|nr:DUF951 domain-containing protein [Dehalogenimonas alkenigignens]KTB47673.1 hypothetical protein DEALK_05180 [Dehalogenimonas alkenigignens]PVV84058.1 DUF951 domain-containing protein [Dehalogenimonas alkenigignens]